MDTFKKTKIVATLGPASNTFEKILALAIAGVNVFRLNFSHGTLEEKVSLIEMIRKINQDYHFNIPILADLQGPKLRVGKIKDNALLLEKETMVYFTGKEVAVGTQDIIGVSYENLAQELKVGEHILLDDGRIDTRVVSIEGDKVKVEVIQGGILSSNKGFNLPHTKLSTPPLTPKDLTDVQFILSHNIEWIALSFVRTKEDIRILREMIVQAKSRAKIIAKIEKPEAVQPDHITSIINASDAIMIARGDLGVEMPIEKIPEIQKNIIRKCMHRATPVIVATQMMESMITLTKPNRSEVTDVANAVLEGTDAVMLSAETATGANPILVVETMSKIIKEVENSIYRYNRENDLAAQPHSPTFLADALCYNTAKIAFDIRAKFIIGMTQSGLTGFTLSSYRPSTPIIVFSTNMMLTNQLSLSWGVQAYHYPPNEEASIDTIIAEQVQMLKEKGVISNGDTIVCTGSIPIKAKGNTNMLKIHIVS